MSEYAKIAISLILAIGIGLAGLSWSPAVLIAFWIAIIAAIGGLHKSPFLGIVPLYACPVVSLVAPMVIPGETFERSATTLLAIIAFSFWLAQESYILHSSDQGSETQ